MTEQEIIDRVLARSRQTEADQLRLIQTDLLFTSGDVVDEDYIDAQLDAIADQNSNGRIEPVMSRFERQPMSRVMPRAIVAALNAPMPANAIWPSESWPAQPVSTVTETAQIANPRILA